MMHEVVVPNFEGLYDDLNLIANKNKLQIVFGKTLTENKLEQV